MNVEIAIVTGVSRGLGEAIAKSLLASGINVIGISRNTNDQLIELAKQRDLLYQHEAYDLEEVDFLEDRLKHLAKYMFSLNPTKLYLVNNAGMVEPVDQAMNINSTDLIKHFKVNAIAPIIIMNYLLQAANKQSVPLLGVNVTSGAAERAVHGWSAYGSSKASINLYTETVAAEQKETGTKNKVIAFNPGIMDTKMQEVIRSSNQAAFKEVNQFIKYNKDKMLKDPIKVSKALMSIILNDTQIVNGKIYDVKSYL